MIELSRDTIHEAYSVTFIGRTKEIVFCLLEQRILPQKAIPAGCLFFWVLWLI